MPRQLTFKCKITRHVSYVSLIHTSHTKHAVLDLFNMSTNHATFNYSGQESKYKYAAYESDIPVTLK